MKRACTAAVVVLVVFFAIVYGHRGGGPDAELRHRLSNARELWADRGSEDYVIELSNACFCSSRTVRVTVRDGDVRSVVDAASGTTADRRLGMSVPDLFDRIGHSHDDAVLATFDPTYGFPVSASFDPSKGAIDDEVGYRMAAYAPG